MTAPGWEGILYHGEEIVWQGTPRLGFVIRGEDIVQSAAGLFFAGFALFWISTASSMARSMDGLSDGFPLFGLPFLAVGAWMFAGRYFWQAYLRRHTFYTLTTKRAFIGTDAPIGGKRLKDYPITQDSTFEMASYDTVFFATETRKGNTRGGPKKIGFVLVDRPADVMRELNKIRAGLRLPASSDEHRPRAP